MPRQMTNDWIKKLYQQVLKTTNVRKLNQLRRVTIMRYDAT